MTIIRSAPQWLAHWAAITPDLPALVIEYQGTFNYGQLAIAVAQMARLLREAGVQRGMVVGIQSANRYLHALAILGVETIGACTLSFSAPEISRGDAAIRRCDWLLHEVIPGPMAAPDRMICLDQAFITALSTILLTGEDIKALQEPTDPDAILRIQRSSGTTGERKAIGHTLTKIHLNAQTRVDLYQETSRECAIIIFYDFHSFPGYNGLYQSLFGGRPLYLVNITSFDQISENVASFHVVAIPGNLSALIANYTRRLELAPFRSLHIIGGEVPLEIWPQLMPIRFGRAWAAYSTSEVLGTSHSNMGAPYTLLEDADMQIVDSQGVPVLPGETGLIEIRTPHMIDRYLWNPELTQRHFVNGWFRTFDVGMMPTPRTLVVTGRANDVLNIGGIKIMPGLFEKKLRALPGVTEAVLISVLDKNNVGLLHVIIEGDKLSVDQQLSDMVREAIGEAAFGYFLHCVNPLPRTDSGKVQRNELKALFASV